VDSALFAPGILNLVLFGSFIAGLATLFSAFDQYRWRTLGIVIGIYMAAAMIKILAMSSDTFVWTSWLTFYSWYEPELAIKLFQSGTASAVAFSRFDADGVWIGFGPLAHNLFLLGGTAACYVIALARFQHRDIPAPL
jgi:ABC-2 type transport system permease protein